ncbi:uncharacterized protein LOC133903183 [Phragmites australis]|uniref:uncharacterized protein LOC133903183 n=1 Tax=Phragmites australis TaxID=29695 RepID=UPI002D776E8E|nr:uncharacterized protein LOC133903183 [Phragmites australis]
MGNSQTAEVAAVVIQHPPGSVVAACGGRVERAHGAISAAAVMAANPGHYVAAVIPASAAAQQPETAMAEQRLKLIRSDDTLALGGVYRVVSLEEVLREFVSKRHGELSCVVVAADDDAHRRESDCSVAKAAPPDLSDPTTEDHRPSGPEQDFGVAAMMLGERFGLARPYGQ